MTASASVVEALAKYDAEIALCPVRQNDARSVERCRKCGATQKDRCGLDNPYPVIEALRATPHPAEQDAREAVARLEELAGWYEDGESGSHLLSQSVAAEHAADLRILLALTQAAPDGWRPIETAPRDGAWVQAWRAPPKMTGPTWEPLIYVRWDDEEESWVWPCDSYQVFTVRGRELADMAISDGDFYFDSAAFTHWRPLPAPPAQGAGS